MVIYLLKDRNTGQYWKGSYKGFGKVGKVWSNRGSFLNSIQYAHLLPQHKKELNTESKLVVIVYDIERNIRQDIDFNKFVYNYFILEKPKRVEYTHTYHYCPNCGALISSPICSVCGYRDN